MYAFISGTVDEIGLDRVVVDCHGVGYEIFTNTASLHAVEHGKATKFYTHYVVRDDARQLYGFVNKEDKSMFERLISVSGVGPKVALSLLSSLSAPEVAMAILSGDEKALSRVPGLGKKTAQRLILELKGALQKEDWSAAGAAPFVPGGDDVVDAAIAVLMAMGFAQQDSAAAVALVKAEGGTAEQMAINALRRLDRG